MSSLFDANGDHSMMVCKFEDQSSCEPYIIGSAQWPEMSKSTCNRWKEEENMDRNQKLRLMSEININEKIEYKRVDNTIGTITSSCPVFRKNV